MVEDSVAPHLVDTIVGDGHCLFRAISKIITGSQTNDGAVRQAVVQWMLCKEHPPELAKRVATYAKSRDVSRDPSKCHLVMKEYIDESDMSGSAWGGDNEITSLATRYLCVKQLTWWKAVEYIQTIVL